MMRRILAGVILIGLGLALLGSQISSDPGRMIFGLAMVLLWSGAGVAVLAGWSIGRLTGLALAAVGVVVAGWEAGQAGPDGNRFLVDVFFLADGPDFAWINVGVASLAFAVLSAIAGLLLILPFRRRPDSRLAPYSEVRP